MWDCPKKNLLPKDPTHFYHWEINRVTAEWRVYLPVEREREPMHHTIQTIQTIHGWCWWLWQSQSSKARLGSVWISSRNGFRQTYILYNHHPAPAETRKSWNSWNNKQDKTHRLSWAVGKMEFNSKSKKYRRKNQIMTAKNARRDYRYNAIALYCIVLLNSWHCTQLNSTHRLAYSK